MSFDPLSFILGKRGGGAPIRDTVSYLMGKAVSAVWKTITNVAVAAFTAVAAPVRELVVDITSVQSGSGDPSPTNIRPISGWTGANIVVSPTQDAQDGTTYTVTWQSEVGEVYFGTLEWIGNNQWKLTSSTAILSFDGVTSGKKVASAGNWATAPGKNAYLIVNTLSSLGYTTPGSTQAEAAGSKCNLLPYKWAGEQPDPPVASYYYRTPSGQTTTQIRLFNPALPITSSTSDSDIISLYNGWLNDLYTAGTPLEIVYPLKTPVEVVLTIPDSNPITLLGQNNVWADTGNINTITYRES